MLNPAFSSIEAQADTASYVLQGWVAYNQHVRGHAVQYTFAPCDSKTPGLLLIAGDTAFDSLAHLLRYTRVKFFWFACAIEPLRIPFAYYPPLHLGCDLTPLFNVSTHRLGLHPATKTRQIRRVRRTREESAGCLQLHHPSLATKAKPIVEVLDFFLFIVFQVHLDNVDDTSTSCRILTNIEVLNHPNCNPQQTS